jgi:16S rRNA (guanine527-N7)-methyltransferase
MEKAKSQLELITRYFADFSPRQLEQFAALDELYKDWNSKINVISRKDIDSLYENHVLHSLSIAAAFRFQPGMEVIDIGTGGGFPGIPLAIFYPGTRFHLVDSIGKKIKVAEAIRDAIGLSNVSTQHGRAEEIRNRKFDVAVSRAVAPLKELWIWAKPLLRRSPAPKKVQASEITIANGLVCLKGGDLTAEIAESRCHPRLMEVSEIFPEEYFRGKFLLHVPFKA